MKFASHSLAGFNIPKSLVEYGKIYISDFKDYSVAFRRLTYKEHKKYIYAISNTTEENILHYIYQELCANAILWFSGEQEDIEMIPAGIVHSLGPLILKLSGPQTMDEFLDMIDSVKENGVIIHEKVDAILNITSMDDTWRDIVIKIIDKEQQNKITYRELYQEMLKKAKLEEASKKSKM